MTSKQTPVRPLDAAWRAEREKIQDAAMPSGRVVVTCDAPFGSAGLGRHLEEIVDALRRREQEAICICKSTPPMPPSAGAPRELSARLRTKAIGPVTRFLSPGRRMWKVRVEFDTYAARRLPAADHLIAFNRQSLAQFHAAKRAHYESVAMMSASTHVQRVAEQHERALRQYPLERSFGTFVTKRYLDEYAQADRIYVASRYSWESFTERGTPDEKMSLIPMTPNPRFEPDTAAPASETFDVVSIGRLCVAKGVPLLVDAFRRLPHADMRLVLIGGWNSPGMRRFLEEARAQDPRIEIGPGDPLPRLRGAGICVHPTYEDGFAYAPAEALACGVPVLVSEDTGMKEIIDVGVNGVIVPTGDLSALAEGIDAAYRGELLSG